MPVAADCRYRDTHEWARLRDGVVEVGITQHAADALTDVTFVQLPRLGATFKAGEEFGQVESVKATSSLYMPIGGTVAEVNDALANQPELINNEPQAGGWMIRVTPTSLAELDALLDAPAYEKTLG